MKKNTSCLAALLIVVPASLQAQDSVITGSITQNGSFDGAVNTDHWDFGGAWRDNGADNVVFDGRSGASGSAATGFHVNVGSTVDLTSLSEVTSLDGYDSSTTRLMGFNMDATNNGSRYFNNGNAGTLDGFVGNYYAEIDVVTTGGTYRYQSPLFDATVGGAGWTSIAGGTWLGGAYLGDLTVGGTILDDIASIDYRMVMNVTSQQNATTNYFIIYDAVNLNAIVTSVPEPSSYALLAGGLALCSIMLRRRHA